MKRPTLCSLLVAIALTAVPAIAQIVPGYIVETYATGVTSPLELSFNNAGVLFAGNGINGPNVQISRIGLGGGPVSFYGPAMYDPDAVLVDNAGLFAPAGSVLVGQSNIGLGGAIRAILPDETMIDVISPTLNMLNPNGLVFDGNGRLVIGADDAVGKVFVSTGPGNLTELITMNEIGASIAVDSSNQIFVRTAAGIVRIYDSNGGLVQDNFVTGLEGIAPLMFGPGNALWGSDLYTLNLDSGDLLRINALGQVTVIGTGFPTTLEGTTDIQFGIDGYMYLSLFSDNEIIRIVPEPSTLALLILGFIAGARRR